MVEMKAPPAYSTGGLKEVVNTGLVGIGFDNNSTTSVSLGISM
jgi:hypothetical protein